MSMDVRSIRSFCENLGLVLGDEDLRRANGEVVTYLDTADVRDAALGMHAFYSIDSVFRPTLFDDDRAIIQALAASGHLGPFGLLPSHQAEFLSLLSVNFGLPHERRIDDMASQLWRDAGILPNDTMKVASLSNEQMRAIVTDQAGKAELFFKAVEFIRGTWHSRLRDWRKRGLLELSRDRDNLAELAAMPLFTTLKNKLNELRTDRRVNNFADALALVSLIQKVDQFRADKTRKTPFPCFYDPTNFFEHVVTEAKCADRLEAELPSGHPARVLRSTEYFVLRTVFDASRKLSADIKEKIFLNVDDLKIVYAQTKIILDAHDNLTAQQIYEGGVSIKQIQALVKRVRDVSFFEHIWLPLHAEEDAKLAVRRLIAMSVALQRSKKLEASLATVVTDISSELRTNADTLKTLRTFWEKIPAWYHEHAPTLALHADTEDSLMRRTGLIRFSLPTGPVRKRIFESLTALISSNEDVEAAEMRNVIRAYFRALNDKSPASLADAEFASAILWVAGMNQYIVRLLETDNREHFSLDLIYAAAAIHLGRDLDRALVPFRRLEDLRKKNMGRIRAEIASGLAYLYYHLWTQAQKSHHIGALVNAQLKMQERILIRRAFERAKEAYDLFEKSDDDSKRVYTLNQVVYCMTLARVPLRRLQPLAEKLRSFSQPRGNWWSYRYDETLAQYYLYLAETSKNDSAISEFLDVAHKRVLQALKDAPEDPEIQDTAESIRLKVATFQSTRAAAHAQSALS